MWENAPCLKNWKTRIQNYISIHLTAQERYIRIGPVVAFEKGICGKETHFSLYTLCAFWFYREHILAIQKD